MAGFQHTLTLLIAAGLASPACAQDASGFFKDKQIRIIVGSAAGAGYDINARTLARYYGKHIAGAPTFVVQNQVGAASITMANSIYTTAPRDGTVIGAPINGMPTAALFTPEVTRYDPVKFIWIGSSNRDTQVSYSWHNSGITKLEDLLTKDYVAGATAPGTTQVDFPLVAARLFGLRYKVVSGYKSTTDIHLAMERGEVQGMGSNGWLSLKTLHEDWIREKKVHLLVQFNFEPNKEIPDVPVIFTLAKTPADRQALALMVARLEYGRPFFLPPDVPADRVNLLRRAFDATMKDPEFLAEAEKLKLDVDAITGEKVSELIRDVMATPPDVIERVKKALVPAAK